MKPLSSVVQCASLTVAVLLSACADNEETVSPDPVSIKSTHAAPFTKGKISVLLGEEKVDDLDYGSRSRSYSTVSFGSGELKLRDAASNTDVFTAPQSLQARKFYSVFIYNPTASTTAALITDDFADPIPSPSSGALIRPVNLGFGTDSVTLTVREAETGAAAVTAGVGYGKASPYAPVAAKDYVLEVRRAVGSDSVLVSKSFAPANGYVYTVLVRGRNAVAIPVDEQLTIDIVRNE